MKKIQKIIENSLYFFSSNFITFTLGMVASIILARTLQPTNLGIYHSVQWFAGIVSMVISFGLITSIIKFTAGYKAKGENQNILSMIKFTVYIELAITLVCTVFLVLFSSQIADFAFSPRESRFFIIAFIAITPGMQTAIFSALLEGAQVFKYQGLHSLTVTPTSLIVKIILMINGYGIESLLWANFVFSIINLSFYIWAAQKENLLKDWFKKSQYKSEEKKEFLAYNNSVFSIQLIDLVVWKNSEIFFLARYCQAAQVAYYQLAHNLLTRITGIIPSLLWKILLPLMSEHEENSSKIHRQKIYYFSVRYSAFILFPIITICLICAYEIIVILYGQEYAAVEACFQIICFGALISSLTQPGSAVIYAANKQKFIFWYGSILAVINVCLNFILIPIYKAQGAALCYTIITVAGSIGGFYYLTRHMKLKVPLFSLFKISFSCTCLALVTYLLIRQDIKLFDVFSQFRGYSNSLGYTLLGKLLDPRHIRLVFSVFFGMIFYLFISVILFKPDNDDINILEATQKYMPRIFIQSIIKLKAIKK